MGIFVRTGVTDAKTMGSSLDKPTAPFGGDPKYSTGLTIAKDDAAVVKRINDAVAEVTSKAASTLWAGKRPSRSPIKDGDTCSQDYLHGTIILNAKTKRSPQLYHLDGSPARAEEFEGGATVNADLCFFAYNFRGTVGIGVGLDRLTLVKPAERDDPASTASSQTPTTQPAGSLAEENWDFLS